MEHPVAPDDLMYQRADLAVQQSTGMTLDQLMNMNMRRSQSSHLSAAPKSLKRKSKQSREQPRSISNASAIAPNESLSNNEISRVDMSRRSGISVQSAPAGVPLSRGASRSSFSAVRSPTVPQLRSDSSDYSASMSAQSQPRHISGIWQEPADFFAASARNFNMPAQTNYTISCSSDPQQYDPELLYATSPQIPWPALSPSSVNSPRPSIDFTDASSVSPFDMSREHTRSSFSSNSFTDPSLLTDLAMLRMKSGASHISSDSQSRHPYQTPIGVNSHPYSQPHFVPDHTSISSNTYINAHNNSLESAPTAFEFTNSSNELPSRNSYIAPDMHRSSSNESSASNTSTQSRLKRRHLETLHQQSQRSIAPARSLNSSSASSKKKEHDHRSPHGEQMIRRITENGEEKMVGVISRNAGPPKRSPQQAKLQCPVCNYHPEGFRGEHELQRHVSRAHAKVRKVWICVDSSPDKTFLANCKACRTKKKYGAYYNAAAHLRRTHFNPRKRGRRSKGEEGEKRGGKGGGTWPPMEHLKEQWMREMDEIVSEDEPESASDPEDDLNNDIDNDIDIDIDQADDAHGDYTNSPPFDANSHNFLDTDFDGSPLNTTVPTSVLVNDLDASPTFDGMLNYYNGELMSQATGMYPSEMAFSMSHPYTQQPVAYNDFVGGQM